LSISKSKQIYKCFVCGTGGNVFHFVSHYENISFIEAVAKVASISGRPIQIETYAKPTVDPAKMKLYNVLNESIKFMKYSLHAENGQEALSYLQKRGLSGEQIDYFDIGYCPSDNALYHYLKAKGHHDQDMVETNLIRITSSGAYDVFSLRVAFSIHDDKGNPVGFSARSMMNHESKYINTSETSLYIKGNIVYNYHRALSYAKKENQVYLVEGVMDVIAMDKAGFKNVVASLGTALTANQVQLLKRMHVPVILAYDGDEAGQQAIVKAIKLFQESGVECQVMQNLTGLDPDEVIIQYGLDELKSMAGKKMNPTEFFFEYYQRKYDLSNYSDKKEFTQLMQAEISKLQDDFDRQNFAHKLTLLTGFKAQLASPIKQGNVRGQRQNFKKVVGNDEAERLLLKLMLNHPIAIQRFKEEIGFLFDDVHQKLAMMIIDYYRKHQMIDSASLLDESQDDGIKQLLLDLSLDDVDQDEAFDEALFDGAKRKMNARMMSDKAQVLKEKIKMIQNPESKVILMNELKELQLERRRLIEDEKE
ncbi:MAG: DNA primase, partial [Erysipelotrichaceae bacterium]